MPVVKRFYSGVFLSGAAVQAGLLPYTAYMFNYVSLGAVAVNVPIVFISGLVVPLGLISMAVSGVSGTLFSLMAEMTGGLCRMMAALNSVTTVDGVTVFTVTSPAVSYTHLYRGYVVYHKPVPGRIHTGDSACYFHGSGMICGGK